VKNLDDRVLMARSKAGDRGAYAELFARHADRIWHSAYFLLHDRWGADDVLQETFTRGLTEIDTYRGEADPAAWLGMIGLNLCRRSLRDTKRHAQSAEAPALDTGRRPGRKPRGVLTSVLRRETERQLVLALGYLTEQQREVFVLHYVEELPFKEIASMLGTTVNAALALAHRARQEIVSRMPGLAPYLPESS
jgi:RNA polymerase sigma-70 factor, ECF subfamily